MDYRKIITLEPGKRSGKPCIRGMRITVYDILGWLASGMTISDIIEDFPELQEDDIYAALTFAADRERKIYHIAILNYYSIKIFHFVLLKNCPIYSKIQVMLKPKV
ncbi:MAG: DUF433 domain-containing protein [Bacteroidia bacterium]|nr:DUF433 domain-containing protein [Bacteroidia bacterium]